MNGICTRCKLDRACTVDGKGLCLGCQRWTKQDRILELERVYLLLYVERDTLRAERDTLRAEREMYFTQRQAANNANRLLVCALMEIRYDLTGRNKDASHAYEIADQALNAAESRKDIVVVVPPRAVEGDQDDE